LIFSEISISRFKRVVVSSPNIQSAQNENYISKWNEHIHLELSVPMTLSSMPSLSPVSRTRVVVRHSIRSRWRVEFDGTINSLGITISFLEHCSFAMHGVKHRLRKVDVGLQDLCQDIVDRT